MTAPTLLDPFDRMSDLDQVLHLVYDHGFDADYHLRYDTNDAVIAMMQGWGPESRSNYHAGDHADYPDGGATDNLHHHERGA